MTVTDVAVLGAGPAGCGAAVQCRRLGLEVALLDRTGKAGGLVREARLLENCPGLPAPVTGPGFARNLEALLERTGVGVRRYLVGSVSGEEGVFVVRGSGEDIRCGSVVLAVGTEPVEYSLETGGNVEIHRSILELKADPPERAVILGGGEAALDYALNLADSGSMVTVLVRGRRLRAGGKLKEEFLARKTIDTLYETTAISAFRVEEGTIRLEVRTPGGRTSLQTGAVLAALGRKTVLPALSFDFHHEQREVATSLGGFYMAGDASAGRSGQASTASGQGVLAGMLACEYLEEKEEKI
ncbi:MAG: NAD(P)/FAD-dependent oxidoreductase [Candidatus Aegiribacteria sp.]